MTGSSEVAATPLSLSPDLPSRWTPTRAGLVALWRYTDETFTFHQGRLLLRGPNGSGKSMALELLLPFLLDGDASPSRLTSSAKSRGGLYERVMGGGDDASRTGFAWVEFRRGIGEVFTVGARLRASSASRKIEATFFTTSQMVGTDLHLIDEVREPLSGKALKLAIGDHGQVHGSAVDHRNAIRERLFPGFSEDRYASVITALLALRKEKLSDNLDLAKLSGVLTEALPPIDEHELAAVAEGFERLDRRKQELHKLEKELAAITELAKRQRGYARTIVAGVAAQVREAESRRDAVTRAEREAGAALSEASASDRQAADRLRGIEERLGDIEVEIETRHASKAYQKGAELDHLRDEERQLRERAERDSLAADARTDEQNLRAGELQQAQEQCDAATNNLTLALDEVHQVASGLGAEELRSEMLAAADTDSAQSFGLAWVSGRRQQARAVRVVIGQHADAVQRRGFEEEQVATDRAALDGALDGRREAERALHLALSVFNVDVGSWARSSRALGPERVLAQLGQPPYGPDAVDTAVGRLRTEIESGYAVARRDLEQLRQQVENQRDDLLAEKADLEEGVTAEPEAPRWRGGREGRGGAPLWRLVEVADGADPTEIDGVEAALGAAGFLDAWLSPDGSIDLSTEDLILTARPTGGRTLADLLVALPGAAVAPDVVQAVLASIAVGTHADPAGDRHGWSTAEPGDRGSAEVLMGTDGSFRLGSAVGQAPVSPAALLGAEARERRRLQRLAEVADALAEVAETAARLDRTRDELDRERAAADADLGSVPSAEPLQDAARATERAQQRVIDAESRVEASRGRLRAAEEAVREAVRLLTAVAAEHGLPNTPEELERIDDELQRLERALHVWARRSHERARADQTLADRTRAHADAVRLRGDAEATQERSRRQAQDARIRLNTLEATAGVEHRAVLAEIDGLQAEARQKKEEQKGLQNSRLELGRRIGTLQTSLAQAEEARVAAFAQRETAHRRFNAADAEGLLAEAGVGREGALDGLTAVLAAAREVATVLDGVASDEASRQKASSQVDDRLYEARTVLTGHVDLARDIGEHDWWILRAGVNGVRRPVRELQGTLERDLAEGRADLAAEEERLFEQTLAGSIRRSLANRIRQANRLVAGINDQLGRIRTAAAGVGVRLSWEVDPDQPAAVKSARSLLLKDRVTDEERRALQEFVRARVDQARAELEQHAPWEARLRESLDYRAWHRFTLQITHQDWEGWQPATPKRLQRLSTGERSIALHLPMLASIAAHYADEDGRPLECPRLILLDELFAGVDAANRAMLFGTFTAWDLDAVFTSDHEWCQYATLSGIAIHHLHPPHGDEPLVSTRFTWDGHRRVIDPSAA
ncbi:MAG: TIGR02680 family protein [Acidimicrobiales bacterium]